MNHPLSLRDISRQRETSVRLAAFCPPLFGFGVVEGVPVSGGGGYSFKFFSCSFSLKEHFGKLSVKSTKRIVRFNRSTDLIRPSGTFSLKKGEGKRN